MRLAGNMQPFGTTRRKAASRSQRSVGQVVRAATAMTLDLAACGGLSERSFETESGSWKLYTQPRFLMGGRQAEVVGFVEMDQTTGCIYLHQPEFDISYPTVWPAGTVVTEAGLRLSDGRDVPDGEWVYGGGATSTLTRWKAARSWSRLRFLSDAPA